MKTSKRSTVVYGTPASFARAEHRLLSKKYYQYSAGIVLMSLAAIWTIANPALPRILVGVFGTAAILFALQNQTIVGVRRRFAVGIKSERRVARVIESIGADVVVHGLEFGHGGDCDHIVAASCLALVETKTGSGVVTTTPGQMKAGNRVLPKDPVKQARRQARQVSQLTGVPVSAIVVVVDMVNEPFFDGDVTVCSLKDLPRVLAAAPAVMTPAAMQKLVTKASAATG